MGNADMASVEWAPYHRRMSTEAQASRPAKSVGWKTIAFPVEHGGWGFTLEPILLGLLVAPSAAAWELSIAALAIFLARRPVKLVATDLVRRRWLRRSSVALAYSLLYGTVALAGVVGATVTASAPFWSPFVVAAPLAALALNADAHSKSRALVTELGGSMAMGATVAAIALADGWEAVPAFGLWLVLVARAVMSIALVRGQIRRVHAKPAGESTIYVVQVATIGLMAAAAALDIVPWLAVVAVGAIAVVAYVSLSRPPVAAKVVGWTQIAVGFGVVLLTAFGVWLEW